MNHGGPCVFKGWTEGWTDMKGPNLRNVHRKGCGVTTGSVTWGGSLLMCHWDSEGPVVIREKRERERMEEGTNSRPWQRLGGHQIGIKGLQGAKGLGWHIGQQMERRNAGRERACVGHSQQ